jgi:uncharacterized protein (DUF2062 family)
MLFKRKEPLSIGRRVRNALWPTRSFDRSMRYMFYRLARIKSTPHSIALGCAAGVFAIFTPFFGFQMLLAAVLAVVLRGNVFASQVGTFAGNPITYPLIWVSTFTLGSIFLGNPANADLSHFQSGAQALGESLTSGSPDGIATAVQGLWPVLKPMALGALVLGGAISAIIYVFIRRLLELQKSAQRPVPAKTAASLR